MRGEAELKRRINNACDELQQELDMAWWTIRNRFSTKTEGDRITAATTTDFEYRQATIMWNLPMAVLLTDDELEATIIHEYVHILMACLWNSLPDDVGEHIERMNELAVENITRTIQAARLYS